MENYFNKPFLPLYDTEGDAAAAAEAAAKAGAGDAKTFTQEQLDKIVQDRLGKERKKTQDQITKMTGQLSEMQLTTTQRDELNEQVESLQTTLQSKEEQIEYNKKKQDTAHQKELTKITEAKDKYKNLYTSSTISRALTDAAIQHDAFNPSQLTQMLLGATTLIDALDDDGQPTGSLTPMTTLSLPDADNEGKLKEVTLAPSELVKRMKEADSQYGNLFKTDAKGGVGGNANSQPGKITDLAGLSDNQAKYRAARRKKRKAS